MRASSGSGVHGSWGLRRHRFITLVLPSGAGYVPAIPARDSTPSARRPNRLTPDQHRRRSQKCLRLQLHLIAGRFDAPLREVTSSNPTEPHERPLRRDTESRTDPAERDATSAGHTRCANKQGVEGVVAKLSTSPYRSGHSSSWKKIRHAETTDAAVVGYTGPAKRPRALVVRLPDGRIRLTRAMGPRLAAQVAAQLPLSEPGQTAALGTGEVYTAVVVDLMVEVVAETTRHDVVTVTRLR